MVNFVFCTLKEFDGEILCSPQKAFRRLLQNSAPPPQERQ